MLGATKFCNFDILAISGPKSLYKWCLALISVRDPNRDTLEPFADAIWRTLVLDSDDKHMKAGPGLALEFTRWLEAMCTLGYLL